MCVSQRVFLCLEALAVVLFEGFEACRCVWRTGAVILLACEAMAEGLPLFCCLSCWGIKKPGRHTRLYAQLSLPIG